LDGDGFQQHPLRGSTQQQAAKKTQQRRTTTAAVVATMVKNEWGLEEQSYLSNSIQLD
jgi:hypothetical protein